MVKFSFKTLVIALSIYSIAALITIHYISFSLAVSDVPIDTSKGISYLLQGTNPYGQAYVINDRFPYLIGGVNAVVVHKLQYPPFALLYYVPFYLLGDIRYGNLVADILTSIIIFCYFRGKLDHQKYVLLYLANGFNFEVNYFVGGNDIVVALFLALTLYCMKYNPKLAGIPYGLSLMSKQFAVLAFPYFLIKAHQKKETRIFLATSILTSLAVFVPFLPNVFNDVVLGIFYARVPLTSYLLALYPFLFMPILENFLEKRKKKSMKLSSPETG